MGENAEGDYDKVERFECLEVEEYIDLFVFAHGGPVEVVLDA